MGADGWGAYRGASQNAPHSGAVCPLREPTITMYQDIRPLYGRRIGALDGEIGEIKDFYFDGSTWTLRYIVVDTGGWLGGRQVLLTRHAFGTRALGRSDHKDGALSVSLTRKQIDACPSTDTRKPVSRQYEEEYYKYYGWPAYWDAGGVWDAAGFPRAMPLAPPGAAALEAAGPRDWHLHSTRAVTGYQIQTTDGQIGKVSSFTVEIWSWAIREVVVETGHWYSGKPIFLLPENIRRISYEDSTVFVNLTTEDIQQTTKEEVAQPMVATEGHGRT